PRSERVSISANLERYLRSTGRRRSSSFWSTMTVSKSVKLWAARELSSRVSWVVRPSVETTSEIRAISGAQALSLNGLCWLDFVLAEAHRHLREHPCRDRVGQFGDQALNLLGHALGRRAKQGLSS